MAKIACDAYLTGTPREYLGTTSSKLTVLNHIITAVNHAMDANANSYDWYAIRLNVYVIICTSNSRTLSKLNLDALEECLWKHIPAISHTPWRNDNETELMRRIELAQKYVTTHTGAGK